MQADEASAASARLRPVLTDHARERCAEMGIPTKQVKRAVTAPEADYPARQGSPGMRTAVRGRLAVGYRVGQEEGVAVVTTVLWNGLESRAEGMDAR